MIEEKPIPLDLDDLHDPCVFRADLLVNGIVMVELKAKTTIFPIDKVQTHSHLRPMNLNVGLLLHFHESKLTDGLHRFVNNYIGPKVSK